MAGGILTEKKDGALAYSIRRANFPDVIQFYAPGIKRYSTEDFEQKTPQAFRPVSLTGSACALNCDHCNTKILEPMIPLRQEEGLFNLCQRLAERGTKGILISGGSQHSGAVPLLKYTDDMARVKEELGLKVMVHCGVPDEKTCAALKAAGVDGVMLDIIGANETIREVYHLNITVTDFERALENLVKHGLSVRPHIILGLHYGKFRGEYAALEMIQKYPVHALILVILTPLKGTPMETRKQYLSALMLALTLGTGLVTLVAFLTMVVMHKLYSGGFRINL